MALEPRRQMIDPGVRVQGNPAETVQSRVEPGFAGIEETSLLTGGTHDLH